MRELFVIDRKNYTEGGTVGRRPSVRGIIIRDGKIAVMHSLKFDYCKLPGGGVEAGESYPDTLVREVREESGLIVIPESVREFGYVLRIEKGKVDDVFIQENFYYLCDAEPEPAAQELDDYEADERFVLEFMTPDQAIEINTCADHKEKQSSIVFDGMISRENRVFAIIRDELL